MIIDVPITLFSDGFDLDRFDEEIDADPNTPDCEGITHKGMNLFIELPGWDEATHRPGLLALVSNHSGQALPDLWLEDLAPPAVDHRTVDYKSGLTSRLHKHIDFNDPTSWKRGEVRRVVYWDSPAHNYIVLIVEVEYVRHPNGLLNRVDPAAEWGDPTFIGRRTIRTWYRKDGTPHPVRKITVKTYDVVEAASEGVRRRHNVYDRLKVTVYGLILALGGTEADALAYVARHQSLLTNYVETGDNGPLLAAIAGDTDWWLDIDLAPAGMPGVTPRMIILDSVQDVLAP